MFVKGPGYSREFRTAITSAVVTDHFALINLSGNANHPGCAIYGSVDQDNLEGRVNRLPAINRESIDAFSKTRH
jgi:hypothetical protein